MGEDDLDDLRHEGWYEDNMRIKKYREDIDWYNIDL